MTILEQVKRTLGGGAAQRETRRAVLALALPLVGSDLLQRGVNVVDALLVGRLGAAELAAVGLSQLLLTRRSRNQTGIPGVVYGTLITAHPVR